MLKVSLDSFKKISVSGPEATDWLKRVLTNNPDLSKESEVYPAAILDYRGRSESLFYVYRKGPNEYILLCDPKDFDKSIQKLDMGIFGEDLVLKEEKSLMELCLEFSEEAFVGPLEQDQFRKFIILTKDSSGVSSLEDFAISMRYHGFVPQAELESRVLVESAVYNAYIHHDKGCYPGQEVINKIISMGKPPKALLRIEHESLKDDVLLESSDLGESWEAKTHRIGKKRFTTLFVKNKYVKELKERTHLHLQQGDDSFEAAIRVWELEC